MIFLKSHFNFLYPDEFFNEENSKGINLLVSFDDGYKDNFDLGFPILRALKIKCIFFVVTGYIGTEKWIWHDRIRYLINNGDLDPGRTEELLRRMNKGIDVRNSLEKIDFSRIKIAQRLMMNWEEVRKVHKAGFKIGAHTENHAILNSVDSEYQEREILESIRKIDKELRSRPYLFAYPNGLYNMDSKRILHNNGILYSFGSKGGINSHSQDKLSLNRIGINVSDSISVVLFKIIINTFKFKNDHN